MSSSVLEDVLTFLDEQGVVQRGRSGFTEADLNGYTGRTQSLIVTNSTPSAEPSLTADIDTHQVVLALILDRGEKGHRGGSAFADTVYRTIRLVLDVTINGTFYPCIRTIRQPYLVATDENGRSQWQVDLEVIRYIGE